MEKQVLYNGKAKQVFSADEEDEVIIYLKDKATPKAGRAGQIWGEVGINTHLDIR